MRVSWGQPPDEQGLLPGPDKGGPDWLKGHRHSDNIAVSRDLVLTGYLPRDVSNMSRYSIKTT